MTMMANEGNDGIEDIDVLNTCHILLPYPDASKIFRMILRKENKYEKKLKYILTFQKYLEYV